METDNLCQGIDTHRDPGPGKPVSMTDKETLDFSKQLQ